MRRTTTTIMFLSLVAMTGWWLTAERDIPQEVSEATLFANRPAVSNVRAEDVAIFEVGPQGDAELSSQTMSEPLIRQRQRLREITARLQSRRKRAREGGAPVSALGSFDGHLHRQGQQRAALEGR